MTRVKVIQSQQDWLLVEWQNGDNQPMRAWVTPGMVAEESGNSEAIVNHPEGGVLFGERWSELITASVSADEIERRLKNAGIWTVEDLQKRHKAALGIIQVVAGDLLQNLLSNARALQKGQEI